MRLHLMTETESLQMWLALDSWAEALNKEQIDAFNALPLEDQLAAIRAVWQAAKRGPFQAIPIDDVSFETESERETI